MEELEDYEEKSFWNGPFKIILTLFLLFIIVIMAVPHYGIKQNPSPNYVPSIDEVFFYDGSVSNETYSLNEKDIKSFIDPSDPIIKTTANKIVSLSCENTHKVCNAKAIYFFVRDNINYVSDPVNFEYVEDVKNILLSESGDCESGTILLASLLNSIGIESEIVLIPRHAFLRVHLPEASFLDKKDDWVYLDWTCKTCDFGELPPSDLGKEERYLQVS